MIGIGTSDNTQSNDAAQESARLAMDNLPKGEAPGWGLAFCGGQHNYTIVYEGFRSELGDIEIVGGAAAGTITHQSMGYSGCECAVALFPSSIPKPKVITIDTLNQGEKEAGRELGKQLRESVGDGDTVFLFYDSVRSSPPPALNVASRLLDGIYDELTDKPIHIIGAGLLGSIQLTQGYVFDGHRCLRGAVTALALPSVIKSHTSIMHGCVPVSSFIEITKIDGSVVYEFDGKPALSVIQDLLGG